jgi:drug/metabolite transporter (DMT)-like permease
VVFLALGVSTFGYVLWYWALGKGGIARMGVLQFLQPVSGVGYAWWLLGEPVTATVLAASAAIMAGVVVATRT